MGFAGIGVIGEGTGDAKLRLCAGIIGGEIGGVLKAQLGTGEHGGCNPVTMTNEVFRVLCGVPCDMNSHNLRALHGG